MTQSGAEKELVLGNKHLISLFFVGAAMCGVFFAMGYMIGRNSKTPLTADTVTAEPGGQKPQPQIPEPPRETAADSTVTAPPPAPAETRVIAPEPKPYDAKTESAVTAPEAGASYLQVTALPRADADNMVRTLREQHFPVILAASSKDGLFRVLVGPYHETAQLADGKARLKTLGFANAFVQKQ